MLARNGRADGKLLVGIFAATGCGIAGLAFALTSQPTAVFVALICITFFGPFSLPLAPGALQDIMPNAMRGQATALYVFLTNTVAGGLGATSVALLTDFVFHDRAKLNVALGIVSATASLAAIALLLAGLAPLRKISEQLVPASKVV
jgi:MFS family permease